MDYRQLELFQVPTPYEKDVFKHAYQLKVAAQDYYNNVNFSPMPISDAFKLQQNKYAILFFDVEIEQIRDSELTVEPSTPKMFIWQFTPTIKLINSGVTHTIHDKFDESNAFIRTKIIPKWINELFTTNSFTHGEFLQFTKQYFTLELIQNTLNNDKYAEEIQKLVESGKNIIIYFGSKFFADNDRFTTSLLELDILNKIKNFYYRLRSLQKPNWYFVSSYNDFINESDLLSDLDMQFGYDGSKEFSHYVKSFQNDYLFLNNAEFVYQKGNTEKWDTDMIIAPSLIDSTVGINNDKLISNTSRAYYCYCKQGSGEIFYRNEILFPSIPSPNEFIELISIAQVLKDATAES